MMLYDMRKMLFLLSLLFLCNAADAQYFNGIVGKYAVEKKADVVHVTEGMMKVARLFVGSKERKLFKMVDNMEILSLKDCADDVKERFLEEIRNCTPQGYETAMHTGEKGNVSKIFAKKSGEDGVAYEMVVASAENRGDVILMIMNGKFVLSEVTEIFK